MIIYEERKGKISPEPVWVCVCDGYMYTADTLLLLIAVLNTEWEHDKHLVG